MADVIMKSAFEKARCIELRVRKAVQAERQGGHRSLFRGRGIDFDEVREYAPGDDVRAINWSVSARAGRPFVKRFREERELTIMLALDVSGSLDFGSGERTKRELSAELACVLALAAMRSRDKVGLVLFTERIESFVPPGSGRAHILRLAAGILSVTPQGRGTDIPAALEFVNDSLKQRAAVVLVSDFHLPSSNQAALDGALRSTAARHELLALRIHDPHEQQLPDVGLLTLEDAETQEVVLLDSARPAVRKAFAEATKARTEQMIARVHGAGARLFDLCTAEDYVPTLLRLFSGSFDLRRGVA
jgi:uncharacterized protein (DUF58 family)